jgi:hypothetical protein
MKMKLPEPNLPDDRLRERFDILVREHLAPHQRIAAGLRALPDTASAMAHTMAAWRFYNNPRVGLPQLADATLEALRQGVWSACQRFVLLVHDWSHLHYNGHDSKRDRIPLSHNNDLGYSLYGAVALSDQDGSPLAPAGLSLTAADGVHSTRFAAVQPAGHKLDGLEPWMAFTAGLGLGLPLVHIIDREADSVAHYRDWHRAGHLFLVRADDDRLVEHEGQEVLLPKVVDLLRQRGAFRHSREVLYKGKKAQQWVAEATVTLSRPAKRKHGTVSEPGEPLTLRLIVSEVRDDQGKVLAVWLLLTNLPGQVSAAEVALWYYWRWRIESTFKLLKAAGQNLEQWQQEEAFAVARRLLVALMACVVVWQLARGTTPQAAELRRVLIRLSGRQMSHGVEYTEPALLAGLWVLLQMLSLLEHYDLDELRRLLAAPWDSPDPQSG